MIQKTTKILIVFYFNFLSYILMVKQDTFLELRKHSFVMQPLQNPPLCRSTQKTIRKGPKVGICSKHKYPYYNILNIKIYFYPKELAIRLRTPSQCRQKFSLVKVRYVKNISRNASFVKRLRITMKDIKNKTQSARIRWVQYTYTCS